MTRCCAAAALVAIAAMSMAAEQSKCGALPSSATLHGYRWECRQVWRWEQVRDPNVKLGCDTAQDPAGCRRMEREEQELLRGGAPK